MIKRVKFIQQQTEKDCGAACLCSLLRYFGVNVPLSVVRHSVKTDQEGTTIFGLVHGASAFNLKGVPLEGTIEELYDEACKKHTITLPIISRVVSSQGFEHFVIIKRISGNKVYIMDPDNGHVSLSINDFGKVFLGQIITFEKTSEFKVYDERWKRVHKYLRILNSQKSRILPFILLSFLITAVGIISPLLIQFIVDNVVTYHDEDTLTLFSLIITGMVLIYCLNYIFTMIRGRISVSLSRKINSMLMTEYYDSVMDLSLEELSLFKTGDLMSRFSDTSSIQEAMSAFTISLSIDTVMAILSGIILYRMSSKLFIIAVILIIVDLTISVIFYPFIDRRNRNVLQKGALLNSYMKESFDGMTTIKALDGEIETKQRTHSLLEDLQREASKSTILELRKDSILNLISSVNSLVILWTGSAEIIRGGITLGTFFSFIALMSYFLNPIENILGLQSSFQSALAASDRIQEIVELCGNNDNSISEEKKIKLNTINDIMVTNIHFRYGTRKTILNGISFKIKGGDFVSVVGKSGCGKTTLLKILAGLYYPEKGSVCINGYNINGIEQHCFKKLIAYVPQEAFFFSGTLKENLTLGYDRHYKDDDINKVLTICGCDFIKDSMMRLNYRIEENSSNISGGQKQRLAIARALLQNPSFLLLDEATSNLDSISEMELLKNIKLAYPNTTLLLVSHRIQLSVQADQIILINNGSIDGVGTHAELLKTNTLYKQLSNYGI